MIPRKINTPLLLPIHWARRRSAATSIVVSDPLDASSILWRLIFCRCCSIHAHLTPQTPPPLPYLPKACLLAPAASVVFSDPFYASSINRPLPTPMLSSLNLRARLTLTKPPSLLSIPWAHKNIGASAVRDIHLYALSLLLPHPMPMLSSLRTWDHLTLPTPPLWSPIHQARYRDAVTSVVVLKSSLPLPFFLSCGRVVYSSSSSDASVIVTESACLSSSTDDFIVVVNTQRP